MSVLITPEWPYCSYPLLVEVYNLCSFNCLYCFTRHKESWHNKASKRRERGFDEKRDILDVEMFEKIFNGDSNLNKTEQNIQKFLDKRMAVQIGGQTEPAGELELKYRKTKRLLEIFKTKGKNYPLRISLKGTAFDNQEYLRIFEGYKNASILISIISTDDKVVQKIEPNTPKVQDRFKLAKTLSQTGVDLGLRLRPIIPKFTENTIEDLFCKAKESGFKWLTVEWLRIPRTMTKSTVSRYRKLSNILGYDIIDYYKKYSDIKSNKNGYLRLKKESTIGLYKKILCLGKSVGLKVASCNKDYRCFRTFTPNCCGLPLKERSWNRMQLSYAVYLAKKKGEVYLGDILQKDSPLFQINNQDNDTKEYKRLSYGDSLIKIWNEAKHRYYPATFFPELEYIKKDNNGNHVFKYKNIGV